MRTPSTSLFDPIVVNKMKRFSDFAEEETGLEGDKVKVDDILNREILVIAYRIRNSKFSKNNSGKYLTIQFELDSGKHIFFTGSDVLIDQMEKYGQEIPFCVTVKKINRYYTFS